MCAITSFKVVKIFVTSSNFVKIPVWGDQVWSNQSVILHEMIKTWMGPIVGSNSCARRRQIQILKAKWVASSGGPYAWLLPRILSGEWVLHAQETTDNGVKSVLYLIVLKCDIRTNITYYIFSKIERRIWTNFTCQIDNQLYFILKVDFKITFKDS